MRRAGPESRKKKSKECLVFRMRNCGIWAEGLKEAKKDEKFSGGRFRLRLYQFPIVPLSRHIGASYPKASRKVK